MTDLEIINELNDKQIKQLLQLYKNEWWSYNRNLTDIKKMLHNTKFVFGFISIKTKDLIAFARVLSDEIYFGIIFDVIVKSSHRNKGIGKFILNTIKNHPIISKMEYLELCCKQDLVPFYKKCGFKVSKNTRMQINPIQNLK